MLRSQELQIRRNEITSRLNDLAGRDTLTAEERTEITTLSNELETNTAQYRAAVSTESESAAETRSASDGESAEIRSLSERARLGLYLQAAVESRTVTGVEAELGSARGLAPGVIPWDAFVPRNQVEDRQDTATEVTTDSQGGPRNQAEILARVFARSATQFLQVEMPSVDVGTASYPVFSSGNSASFAAKGSKVDAGAATIVSNVVNPTRLSVGYLWGIEDEASLRGLESALRDDASMAMSDKLDSQIIAGDGTAPNLSGFLDATSGPLGAAPTASGSSAYTWAQYVALLTGRVDGLYANALSEVRCLVGPGIFRHQAGIYRAAETDETAEDYYRVRSGGYRISANMPALDSSSQKVGDLLFVRGMTRAAVAPVWSGVRAIRDEVTNASSGRIRLTLIALYGFKVIRADQYSWQKANTA